MSSKVVLIVEDDPLLRGHLSELMRQQGIRCIVAQNENEAFQLELRNVSAVVADIDLSEAGGDRKGGILLAKGLAERKIHIPIILVSAAPPLKDDENWGSVEAGHVCAILDRSRRFSSFCKDLMKHLHKVLED